MGGIFLSSLFDQQKLGLPVTNTTVSSGTTLLKSSYYLAVNKFFLTTNYSSLFGNIKNAYILYADNYASENYVKNIGNVVKETVKNKNAYIIVYVYVALNSFNIIRIKYARPVITGFINTDNVVHIP